MTERKARTGARFAREKQVLRCAQNDNQKGKGKGKGKGKSNSKGKSQCRDLSTTRCALSTPAGKERPPGTPASVEMTRFDGLVVMMGFAWFGSEAVR
jgi:hypothetical protein